LPPELLPVSYIQGRRLFIIAGLTLLFGALLIGSGIFFLQVSSMKAEINANQVKLAALEAKVKDVTGLQTQRQNMERKTADLEILLQQKKKYIPLLDELAENIPVDAWLTGISIQGSKSSQQTGTASYQASEATSSSKTSPAAPAPGRLVISGTSLVIKGVSRSVSSIGVYVRKLLELPYFSEVYLDEFKEQDDETMAFTITCSLKMGGGHIVAKARQ
jgi:type IV pilus assembly protein PilN